MFRTRVWVGLAFVGTTWLGTASQNVNSVAGEIAPSANGVATVNQTTPTLQQTTPTHKQVRVIRPELESASVHLNTFAMSPDGQLWLCCSSSGGESANAKGCILIYSAEGEQVRSISLHFAPQAINFSADGTPFVAGSGKVARLTKDGEFDFIIKAPNLFSEAIMKERLAKSQAKMIEQMLEGSQSQLKRLESQIATLKEQLASTSPESSEAVEGSQADDATAVQESDAGEGRLARRNRLRLRTLEEQHESLKSSLDQQRTTYKQMFGSEIDTSQVKRSTGIAVTNEDVFVSLPSLEGHGYAIYRMTHDLTEATIIKDGVGGCCGQLDIQTDGEHLIIAANSAFEVQFYDRDGKALRSFGRRYQSAGTGTGSGSIDGWGSCCNPMNVRAISDKEILVAESSIGHIKRYTNDGEFLGLIGTARIAGGCKHVAIAKAVDRDWYFMMNTAGNNIAVLVPREEAPAETDDERDERLAMEGLGKKLIGTWQAEDPAVDLADSVAAQGINEEGINEEGGDESDDATTVELQSTLDFGSYIAQQNRYLQLLPDGRMSRAEPQVLQSVVAAQSSVQSDSGILGAIIGLLAGSSPEPAVAQVAPVLVPDEAARWIAIKQEGDVVHMAIEEAQVRNYVAAVRFVDDDRAEFKWYYGEVNDAPMATVFYRRMTDANGASVSCVPGGCDAATCTKPNCDHSQPVEPTVPTNVPVQTEVGESVPSIDTN